MKPEVVNLGCVRPVRDDGARLAIIGLDAQMRAVRYSAAELDALADGVAAGLRARGLSPGERVALLGANSVAYVAAVLGIMRAGLVAVPLNHRWPDTQIDYALADSGARLVFCDPERMRPERKSVEGVSLALEDTEGLSAFVGQDAVAAWQPAGSETALMLYTSGSTGRPKGVLLSHAAQLWVVRTRLQDASLADERALIAAPLYHMNALALILLALASGATAVLLPQFTARAYIEAVGRYRCTWLTAVPPMIAMMLREQALLAQTDLGSVRVIRMGSAPVSASLLAQIRQWLPNARIINAYGTTEGGPVVFGPHPQGIPTPPLAVGYAHAAVQLRLRDGAGREVPDEGVLEIRSAGLMSGYHNRADLAAPFTVDGYYVTGDVFRRDAQGFYTFVGRRDDMFVCGGENIYPGEIEKLLERHPGVQQACVVPIDDDIKGQKPVAFVVLRPEVSVTAAELKAFALAHGAAYQHPRHVWLLPTLPLAATNKIDRQALKRDAQARLQID
ncbi:class I adenylate-forming enzyme family protein [Corticimicrobacter populi]|uniref:Acetyl-CoA synthetase n=1 Tax=Corticimicrobacter populi TaxID=2175229 RepID=A0A2V1JVY4_9BURK|nr:class I adenylate-forming enzyme family protein [Corticimicrobacter populi]PWF22495.1 acetyl-CoA synthetase [Corticimicrobacter populi]